MRDFVDLKIEFTYRQSRVPLGIGYSGHLGLRTVFFFYLEATNRFKSRTSFVKEYTAFFTTVE